MLVKSFCWSCGTQSETYKNKNNGKISKYCNSCYDNFTPEQRKLNEYKFIMASMKFVIKNIDISEE